MEQLINKYLYKLNSQGLVDKDSAFFLAVDADIVSNRPLSACSAQAGITGESWTLANVFSLMNISTLLFSEPLEPYRSIIKEILRQEDKEIVPMDCETRTFFHDIPVIHEFSPEAIAKALSHRKSAIIKDRGIVTYGVVTPEQAFVSFSSTCFSTFVKYFYDSKAYFEKCRSEGTSPDKSRLNAFNKIILLLNEFSVKKHVPCLTTKAPQGEEDIIGMLSEAGRAVVEYRLVDSYFGNISYVYNNKIYISQTGSSMDELECCIDPVPLDGSSSAGITASSELSAHKNIYYTTGDNAILHGHPKFSVIMSMHCEKKECRHYPPYFPLNKGGIKGGVCHKGCREKREIADVPIVSGEIGTGPTGLMHTVPAAMRQGRGAIVYGHGVFTSGINNFQKPFNMLMDIENRCREEYFKKISEYL
jgi:ribulose-5-phosphate 4-epimerase/fuculose-1-phosphate aldolase